jgi:hypothetical protein
MSENPAEEIQKVLQTIEKATDGATEGCGLFEAVSLLISQRDNAQLHADTYLAKLRKGKP